MAKKSWPDAMLRQLQSALNWRGLVAISGFFLTWYLVCALELPGFSEIPNPLEVIQMFFREYAHDDHYWLSLADGDLLQWALGLAVAQGFDVDIEEPDVSPLAIQGPKSDELMARVFGEEVRNIRFFRYKKLKFEGQSFVVARSGWSKQGGFEIYVEGEDYGMPLWNALFAAGADLNVRAGCPNLIERIEGGLLSYGADMRRDDTPYECGLGRFCNSPDMYFGRNAMARQAKYGPDKMIRAIAIEGEIETCGSVWPLFAGGAYVGQVTSATWSPDFNTNVAIGMVARSHWNAGTRLEVDTSNGMRTAIVQEKFWI